MREIGPAIATRNTQVVSFMQDTFGKDILQAMGVHRNQADLALIIWVAQGF